MISHCGGKFFHLDAVLARIQTVFLGKSFIIGEQSPLEQSPKDLREHCKRYACVCVDVKEKTKE